MTGSADPEALAERYLDFWERQLAVLVDDTGAGVRLAAFAAALQGAGPGATTEEPPGALPDRSESGS